MHVSIPALCLIVVLAVFGILMSWLRVRAARTKLSEVAHDLRLADKETRSLGNELTIVRAELDEALSLVSAADSWCRKYWEMNDLVASCLEQRDEWKGMWFTESGAHLEGHAD